MAKTGEEAKIEYRTKYIEKGGEVHRGELYSSDDVLLDKKAQPSNDIDSLIHMLQSMAFGGKFPYENDKLYDYFDDPELNIFATDEVRRLRTNYPDWRMEVSH